MNGQAEPPHQRLLAKNELRTKGRRQLVVTVTSVMAVSTLMQYSLSAISPFLLADFDLSPPQYGSFFTVYFIVCSVGSLLLGGFVQRIGAQPSMALVGLFSFLGLGLAAIAPGPSVIYVGLVFAGISGAICNPATNLALMHVESRGPLVGIKQSGVQLSAVAAGLLVAPAALAFGWREALMGGALVSLALIPAVYALRPGRIPGLDADATEERIASVRGLALYAFLMGLGLASTIAYLPVYAVHDAGFSAGEAGRLVGIFGLSAVIGRIGWGILSERSQRFGKPNVSLVALAVGALVATVILALGTTGAVWPIYVGSVLIGLTGAAWNGLVMTLVIATSEPSKAGKASGRVQSAFFAGLCISPLGFGFVVDRTGSYVLAWASTGVVYVLAAIAARMGVARRQRVVSQR